MNGQPPELTAPQSATYPPAAQLRRLFDLSPDVLCISDRSGRFISVSPACRTVWGFAPEEVIGRPYLDFVNPEDRQATEAIAEAISSGAVITAFENRHLCADGSYVSMMWSANWDDAEGVMFSIGRDITEHHRLESEEAAYRERIQTEQDALIRRQRETEEQLRRSNERFALAARSDAIYDWDIVSNHLQWGEGLFTTFGYRSEEFQLADWELQLHPQDHDRLILNLEATLNDPGADLWEAEYQIRHSDGSWRHAFEKAFILRDAAGKAVRMVGRMQDLTRLRNAELEQQKLSIIARQTSNAVAILDTEYRISWINPAYTKVFGYTFEEALGKRSSELITGPDTDSALIEQFRQDMLAGREFRGEFVNYTKDGRRIHTDITGQPVLASDGRPLYFFVMARDVTRRVERELEFRKLSLIMQQTDDGIIITDKHKRTTWVNDGFIRMTGFSADDMLGRRPADVLQAGRTDLQQMEWIEQQYAAQRPFSLEVLNYKKDGTPFWSLLSIQPLYDENGEIVEYFSIRKDITGSKRLEQQLDEERKKTTAAVIEAQEKERTAVSQELHDNVNQVLTTVKLYQELCLSGLANRDELTRKSMTLLQESINEIRSLSKRLSAPSLGKIRLHESIGELTEAIAATGKLAVALDTAEIEGIEVDSTLHIAVYRILQEQLTNVLKHAQAQTVWIRIARHPGAIAMTVTDDGVGFDLHTTRGGSGLTNIRSRTESLQGKVSLQSAPGAGCTLEIELPFG